MRRWLILLLLAVLPLQFASAGVASYCLHETGTATWHLGHHQHKHHSPTAKVAGDAADSQKAKNPAGLDDTDCEYCHLSAVSPLLQDFSHTRATPDPLPTLQPMPSFGTRDPDTLDRPNWLALAWFGEGSRLT